MFYAVSGGEEYILIKTADNLHMIAKDQIIGVVITGLEKVRVDTKDPGNSYCFDYTSIVQPKINSVFELAQAIRGMLQKKDYSTHAHAA